MAHIGRGGRRRCGTALALCVVAAGPVLAQGRYVYVDGTRTSLNQRVIAVLDATTHEVVATLASGVDATTWLGGLAVTSVREQES